MAKYVRALPEAKPKTATAKIAQGAVVAPVLSLSVCLIAKNISRCVTMDIEERLNAYTVVLRFSRQIHGDFVVKGYFISGFNNHISDTIIKS